VVIGGTYILGGRGHYVGTVAEATVLTALISVLLANNAPDYARDIAPVILPFCGRQSEGTA
jgi:ribose/xylose/arabinose/galactoside ABC-type transport system permease subunit